MLVRDLFSQLSFGDLSNLSLAGEGSGEILAESQPRIVTLANAALKTLHARFTLRRAFLPLTLQDGVQTYEILPDPAQGGSIVKILAAERLDDPSTQINEAAQIGLNSRCLPNGVKIAAFNTLRFEQPVAGARYVIEAQVESAPLALPPDLDQTVPVPTWLEAALLTRVAASVFLGMGGELHMARGRDLLSQFEQHCSMAKTEDFALETSSTEHNRFADKGFI